MDTSTFLCNCSINFYFCDRVLTFKLTQLLQLTSHGLEYKYCRCSQCQHILGCGKTTEKSVIYFSLRVLSYGNILFFPPNTIQCNLLAGEINFPNSVFKGYYFFNRSVFEIEHMPLFLYPHHKMVFPFITNSFFFPYESFYRACLCILTVTDTVDP